MWVRVGEIVFSKSILITLFEQSNLLKSAARKTNFWGVLNKLKSCRCFAEILPSQRHKWVFAENTACGVRKETAGHEPSSCGEDRDETASHCHACHFVLSTMDAPVDDEKKAFDAETAQDEDSQPDPEEHLMLDQGNGRIWLVKVRIKHCCRPLEL